MVWAALPAEEVLSAARRLHAEKAEAEAAEGGEAPASHEFESCLDAAQSLLPKGGSAALWDCHSGCLKGESAADDYTALCARLGFGPPHPAALKALDGRAGVFSLRGWKVDLASLVCMLGTLEANKSSAKAVRLWGSGMDAASLTLLASQLPDQCTKLSLEGEPPADTAALEALAALDQLTSLSLRCASLEAEATATLPRVLASNGSLTSLSLFGNPLGNSFALALFAALRSNTTLRSLDLGRTALTDATAAAVLRMVEPEEAPAAAGEGAEEPATDPAAANDADATDAAPAAVEPSPPNASLAALNLSYNGITTIGRGALETAQATSAALEKVDLAGNPCMRCGPTASMGVASRQAIGSSWQAMCEAEEGAAAGAALRKAIVRTLAGVPEALPVVGYTPPPPPPADDATEADGTQAADPKALADAADAADTAAGLEAWEGLEALSGAACSAISELVGALGQPESLQAQLHTLGVLGASHGLPAGRSFELFGEALLSSLAEGLGEAWTEEVAAAWRAAYAEAAACMQEAFTPSQIAAAKEAAAAAAATAEAEEPPAE